MQQSVDDQFGETPSRAYPEKAGPAQPMTPFAAEIAARVKETFYAYTSRMDRNAQKTLGPSEIGTPCDRRLVMHLLGCDPVNPGTDNWASFVGTCIHVGLGEMFNWANANTGRYAVEMPLNLPSVQVPKGTGDLLDRVLCMFIDHKAMGSWSLNKLMSEGPNPTYRVQLHTYGMGAEDLGEQIEHVALIAWPRERSTLRNLYVWTEPYDRRIAEEALKRVDDLQHIANKVSPGWSPLDIAASFDIADDCKFCPYHMPNSKSLQRSGGCNGKT